MPDYSEMVKELCGSFGGRGWHELAALLDAGYKGEYVALRLLRDGTAPTLAGDLSKKMSVSTARVAAMLKSLEKKGYILRTQSKTDARSVVITLTPPGLTALQQREREVHAFIEKMLKKLTPEEAQAFIRIAEKLFG